MRSVARRTAAVANAAPPLLLSRVQQRTIYGPAGGGGKSTSSSTAAGAETIKDAPPSTKKASRGFVPPTDQQEGPADPTRANLTSEERRSAAKSSSFWSIGDYGSKEETKVEDMSKGQYPPPRPGAGNEEEPAPRGMGYPQPRPGAASEVGDNPFGLGGSGEQMSVMEMARKKFGSGQALGEDSGRNRAPTQFATATRGPDETYTRPDPPKRDPGVPNPKPLGSSQKAYEEEIKRKLEERQYDGTSFSDKDQRTIHGWFFFLSSISCWMWFRDATAQPAYETPHGKIGVAGDIVEIGRNKKAELEADRPWDGESVPDRSFTRPKGRIVAHNAPLN